jgi:hypothetical protein
MPTDNGKIMIPWPLAETLIYTKMSATTLRLVVSMLHQLDLADVCGPAAPIEPPTIWASCAALRERVGPKRPNGARDFHMAMEELLQAGILVKAVLLSRNTDFQWRFTPWIWELMRERDWSNYVLIDLVELGRCKSWFTVVLYLQMRKLHGTAAPQFLLAINSESPVEPQIKRLIQTTQRVADILNIVCYIGLEYARQAPQPERFHVKMVHSGTRWHKHSYLKFRPGTQVWRVDRSGSQRFNPRSVRQMRVDLMSKNDAGLDYQIPRDNG